MAEELDPVKAAEILNRHSITGAQLEVLVKELITPLVDAAMKKTVPSFLDQEMHKAGYSEEVAGLLHMLAAKANDPKETTLLKALTLYGLALDAREKGNHLAIINANDEIIHDVVGFETHSEELDPVGI